MNVEEMLESREAGKLFLDEVFDVFNIDGCNRLADTFNGIVVRSYVPEGGSLKNAFWWTANKVETDLYRAWRRYVHSTQPRPKSS